jgi:hypothetical protein
MTRAEANRARIFVPMDEDAFIAQLEAALAEEPSGVCSAHQRGEDPKCRTCYPVADEPSA